MNFSINLKQDCAQRLLLPVLYGLSLIFVAAQSRGDEIVIDSRGSHTYRIGEVDFSVCRYSPRSLLSLPTSNYPISGSHVFEMTAGELWQYYKDQGIDSTDRIVLYFGVDHIGVDNDLVFKDFEFSIMGGQTEETRFKTVRFGSQNDDRLIIPGYETFDSKPEARMEIPLGFDFMTRFNQHSSEKIQLNASFDGLQTIRPQFFIEGRRSVSVPTDFKMVTGFVLFWVVLFWLLKLITFRTHDSDNATARSLPSVS